MLFALTERIGGLWQQIKRLGAEKPTVLAITNNDRLANNLRVLAIQNAWEIRFATNLGQALVRQPREGICVAVYDRDQGRVTDAVRQFSRSESPVLTIVLSGRADASIRSAVIRCGGFDLVTAAGITRAVNAAIALVGEIDSSEAPVHV